MPNGSSSRENLKYSKLLIEHYKEHNKQRFAFINYFIILMSFLSIAAYFSYNICHSQIGQILALIFLGFVMIVITVLFSIFEMRVKILIESSIKKMIQLEQETIEAKIQLFSYINKEFINIKEHCLDFSYSVCFKFLLWFSCFAYIILLIFIGSLSPSGCPQSKDNCSQKKCACSTAPIQNKIKIDMETNSSL